MDFERDGYKTLERVCKILLCVYVSIGERKEEVATAFIRSWEKKKKKQQKHHHDPKRVKTSLEFCLTLSQFLLFGGWCIF